FAIFFSLSSVTCLSFLEKKQHYLPSSLVATCRRRSSSRSTRAKKQAKGGHVSATHGDDHFHATNYPISDIFLVVVTKNPVPLLCCCPCDSSRATEREAFFPFFET
ncbi:unnamed protein product, partial [Ectocarpus sp. 4 AP-2014]